MVLTTKYGATPAGTITKEQTLLSTARLPVAASTLITKGQVCVLNATGEVITAVISATSRTWYVALETVDNSAGAAGALTVPLAKRGHYVTVVADGAIQAGRGVKMSAATAGQVVEWVEGTDDTTLQVGIYHGQEGGKITKDSVTPFLEARGAEADFVPFDAADGDIIEIELS